MCKEYFTNLRRKKDLEPNNKNIPDNEDLLNKIKEEQKKCLNLAKEKTQLALQTYNEVDQHIKTLDSKIDKFDQELKESGIEAPIIGEDIQYEPFPQKKSKNNNQISRKKI